MERPHIAPDKVCAALLGAFCLAVFTAYGRALVPAWAQPGILRQFLLGAALLLVPLLLIAFPRALGERAPAWLSGKTGRVEAYVLGWLLLLAVVGGACLMLWSELV